MTVFALFSIFCYLHIAMLNFILTFSRKKCFNPFSRIRAVIRRRQLVLLNCSNSLIIFRYLPHRVFLHNLNSFLRNKLHGMARTLVEMSVLWKSYANAINECCIFCISFVAFYRVKKCNQLF